MQTILTTRLPSLFKLVVVLGSFLSIAAHAEGDVHDRWATYDIDSVKVVDHKPMTNILSFIAVPQDNTKYNLTEVNPRVMAYITQYKKFLQKIAVSELNKDEQLAYWLNLYNVAVIEKMGANRRNNNRIKKLRGEPGNAGRWWSDKSIEVEGVLLSLEDIEQNVLARHWQDPLFLYGLFYGVNGDGFSSRVAFTGETVHRQLKTMAKAFVNDKDNIKISRGQARVSSLLVWNKASIFENSDEVMLSHIREFANNKTAKKLEGVSQISSKHKFDWRSAAYSPPSVNRALGASAGGGGASAGGGGGYRGGS